MTEPGDHAPSGAHRVVDALTRPITRARPARFTGGLLALAVMYGPQATFLDGTSNLSNMTKVGGLGYIDLVGAAVFLATAVLALLTLPLVSYRRIDFLIIAFVPVWGWIVTWRLGWRLALLPWRDWQPRYDEVPYTRYVPGTELYMLDRTEQGSATQQSGHLT